MELSLFAVAVILMLLVWLARVREGRRFSAALDAYVQLELAREWRSRAPSHPRSVRLGMPSSVVISSGV